MTRLFVNLYLDEDVSVLVAKLVRSRGLSALTTQEAGQLGISDVEQLARQYREAGRTHGGIIIAVRRPPQEIARRLFVLLNQLTADEMDNQILYI